MLTTHSIQHRAEKHCITLLGYSPELGGQHAPDYPRTSPLAENEFIIKTTNNALINLSS